MIAKLQKALADIGRPKRSAKWPGVRKEHLRLFPCCAACGGRDDLEVHHKEPYHLKPELELAKGNLLTLCESGPYGNCHLIIGHNGSWKDWNANAETTASHSLAAIRSIRSGIGRATPAEKNFDRTKPKTP